MNYQVLQKKVLIAIEGIDGAGKSSLAQQLTNALQASQLHVTLTKEPGGTPFGLELRKLLLTKDAACTPLTQFLLFSADRSEHFNRIVIPALNRNHIVISDRMNDSSIAYQSYGNGIDQTIITHIDEWTMQGVKADIVFYLRIDIDTALNRIQKRGETTSFFEKRDFLTKVLHGFEVTFTNRKNVCILDGTQPLNHITEKAFMHIIQWLTNHQ